MKKKQRTIIQTIKVQDLELFYFKKEKKNQEFLLASLIGETPFDAKKEKKVKERTNERDVVDVGQKDLFLSQNVGRMCCCCWIESGYRTFFDAEENVLLVVALGWWGLRICRRERRGRNTRGFFW